jgi:tRNA nucleotidyltransferase/poly(A) polymerase
MRSILEVNEEFKNILNNNSELKEIIEIIHRNNFQIHLVGGCIRDVILGIKPYDFDLVTNATPKEIISLFKDREVDSYGESFLVVVVNGFEIATYRKDFKNTGSSTECKVERVETLKEDLSRRDFTCNAMAYDPISFTLIDPYKGYFDLSYRIVRFVGDPDLRIKEDPIRILRACRFISKLEGYFETKTARSLEWKSYLIKQIPKERIILEIKKALEIEKASLFFRYLYNIRGLGEIFPSLNQCVGQDGGLYHNETIFNHSMCTGDLISTKEWRLKLAGYLHDVGKPICVRFEENGDLSFKNHAKKGSEIIHSELTTLKFSKFDVEYISNLVFMHMFQIKEDSSKKVIKRFLIKLEDKNLRYKDWLRLLIADRKGNRKKKNYSFGEIKFKLKSIDNIIQNERMFSLKDLAINGKDIIQVLNIKPGREVGRILKDLFEDCLNNPEHNTREFLLEKIKGYKNE